MKTQQLRILFSDRKLFGAMFCIIIGFVFLGFFLSKDKVESKSDLVEIKGILQDFSFTEHNGYRSHTYSYFIYLQEYNSRFQIIADFINGFNKDYFERTVRIGDSIRIYVSRNDFTTIQNKEKIKVFGIYSKNAVYLDSEFSISEYNSGLIFYGGLIFIAVGIVLLYSNKDKLIVIK